MFNLDFLSFSPWVNGVIFVVAAAFVWWAGTNISRYADTLSDRLNLGKAFVGLLFLALATETPEIATTVTATARGNPSLALNNIFGGVVMQTAILAVVDLALIKGALTFFVPRPVLLLQGMLLVFLLSLVTAAIVVGEKLFLGGIGLWTAVLFGAYVVVLYLSQQYEGHEQWEPSDDQEEVRQEEASKEPERKKLEEEQQKRSTWQLGLLFLGGTAVILAAGFVLARVAEALAEQTGLGTSFIGGTLLAASTSLPEVSTTIMAVRLGNYQMAVSNIFGSNSIMVALLFLSDVFYREGPILNAAGNPALFMTTMGTAVTAIYLVGMVERRNNTFLRMGYDSVVVLVLYVVSVILLYTMRGEA
jgi:cation:H+ antiporter